MLKKGIIKIALFVIMSLLYSGAIWGGIISKKMELEKFMEQYFANNFLISKMQSTLNLNRLIPIDDQLQFEEDSLMDKALLELDQFNKIGENLEPVRNMGS